MSAAEQVTKAILAHDGRLLIEQPDGSYRLAESETDWAPVDAMSESELEAAIASDPDDPGNDPTFWERARVPHRRLGSPSASTATSWTSSDARGPATRNASRRCCAPMSRRIDDAELRHGGAPAAWPRRRRRGRGPAQQRRAGRDQGVPLNGRRERGAHGFVLPARSGGGLGS